MTMDSKLCACSTFAIGLCWDCKDPVCGDHSKLAGGKRRCFKHVHALASSEAAARLAHDALKSGAQQEANEELQEEPADQITAEDVSRWAVALGIDVDNPVWPFSRSMTSEEAALFRTLRT